MARSAKKIGGPALNTRGGVATTFTPVFGKSGRKGKGRSASKMRGKSGR